MPKRINSYINKSLSELEWEPGELVAFDNTDLEFPSPLLLTFPEKIVRGFGKSTKGIKLFYFPEDAKEEEQWTVYPKVNVLELWSPGYKKDSKVPNFKVKSEFPNGNIYFVENALAGKETIKKYLERDMHLDFYADWLEPGKLIRSRLENILEKLGFGFILQKKLRFS